MTALCIWPDILFQHVVLAAGSLFRIEMVTFTHTAAPTPRSEYLFFVFVFAAASF